MTWPYVFIPLYFIDVIYLFLIIKNIHEILQQNIFNATTDTEQRLSQKIVISIQIISEKLWFYVIQIAFTILFIVKITTPESFSWVVAFTPIWIWGVIRILWIAYFYFSQKRQTGNSDFFLATIVQCITFVIFAGFIYSTAGLLISRLNNTSQYLPTAAVILIPGFIVLSIIFCCFCCCGPLTVMAVKIDLEEEIRNGNESNPIPLERRIKMLKLDEAV